MKCVCHSCEFAKPRNENYCYCVKYGIMMRYGRIYCVSYGKRKNEQVRESEDRSGRNRV